MPRPIHVALALLVTGCSTPTTPPPPPVAAATAPAQPEAVAQPPKPQLPPRPAAERKVNTADKGSCNAADLSMVDGSVVASVDGKDITLADLGADYVSAEKKALAAYCTELDRLRQAAVDRAVQDKLLTAAAAAEDKDADSFLREKVSAAVQPPTDDEIASYYAQFKREGAPELEAVRPQVERALMEEQSKKAFETIIEDLRSKAQVQTMLPDVRPPALDVDIPAHAATFGPDGATVEVVEFSDFECPYCARAATAVSEVKKRYGDRVRFAFRHFPLSFHANALPAAEYSQCANEQGKFWALHDEIFANQSELGADSLKASATKAGLNLGDLESCLASGRAREAIDADMKKAAEVGVEGTPSFYINGRQFQGNLSGEALGAAIDAELG